MMTSFAGMKRKQHAFGFVENQDQSEPPISKKYKKSHFLHSVYSIANEECLKNDWTTQILDGDRCVEHQMETLFTNNISSTPSQCSEDSHAATVLPEACKNSANHISGQLDSALGVRPSLVPGKVQTAAQSTLDTFNPNCDEYASNFDNHVLSIQQDTDMQFHQHSSRNIASFSLQPPESQEGPRCPECAAGKSGHIHHIGRWKLMDTQ